MANLQELIPAFFIGPNGQPLTPEQIAQRQEVAKSLLQQATDTSPNAGGWASVLAKGLQGGIAGYQQGRADDAAALNAKTDQANIEAGLGSIFGGGIAPVGGIGGAFPSAVAQGASPTSGVATGTGVSLPGHSSLPSSFLAAIDKTEGGGSYDTLYGHAQNKGPFAGVAVSQMPISDVLAFTSPSGKYAQSVKSQIGRVATPVGRHQIVGTTLRNAVNEMGLDPSTPFNRQTQDAIAAHLARKRIAGSNTMQGKIAALRSEWEGLRNVPDAQVVQIINDLSGGGTPQQAIQAIAPIEQGDENPMAGMPVMPQGTEYVDPLVAPFTGRGSRVSDFTQFPEISTAPSIPFDQGNFDERFGGPAPVAPQTAPMAPQPTQTPVNEELLAQHDAMWGGALSPTGRSAVAQALTGYFPDAPSANRAPITAQNNAMSQAPMQQPAGGVNPQIIASLLGPNSSPQARQVGALLLGHHQQQQAAMQAQQQAQQELARRQQVAQSMGIDPNAAMDLEAWKAAVAKANRDRSTVTVGNTVIDANTMQPIYEGQQSPTGDIQNYEYARQNGYGGSFADYQQEVKRAGATNVSTVVGGDSDEYRKEFEKSMGAATAKTFTDAMNAGDIARRNRINLDRISQLASSTPQGFEGATIRALGEYGIKTEGLDKVQAMESLISQMVPSQRPPGSGTISDADLALYKASLPRLINSPEGNSLILETLYAINDHDIAASDIAARVASREITPTEARKLMRQIPNPFDDWREKVDLMSGVSPSGSKTKTGVTWSFD